MRAHRHRKQIAHLLARRHVHMNMCVGTCALMCMQFSQVVYLNLNPALILCCMVFSLILVIQFLCASVILLPTRLPLWPCSWIIPTCSCLLSASATDPSQDYWPRFCLVILYLAVPDSAFVYILVRHPLNLVLSQFITSSISAHQISAPSSSCSQRLQLGTFFPFSAFLSPLRSLSHYQGGLLG